MKNLRKIFILGLLLIFVMINTISYGVEVTDESLKQAFESFAQSSSNEQNYTIEVSNNVITLSAEGQEYKLNYDLIGKPTFTYEVSITQGMSYDEFQEETSNLTLPMLGYIAVANIQGIEIEDASAYIAMNTLGNAFQQMGSSSEGYVIVDDLNVSEGVTIEKTDDPKTIYASEFGDRVMEYVNSLYSQPTTMNDSEGINSYEWTYEQKDTTDTSCKIVSTLSVDLSVDYSKLKGYAEQMGDAFTGGNQTSEDENEISVLNEEDDDGFSDVETITENTQDKVQISAKEEDLPKTGISNTMYIIIAVALISVILIALKIHSYKDVK